MDRSDQTEQGQPKKELEIQQQDTSFGKEKTELPQVTPEGLAEPTTKQNSPEKPNTSLIKHPHIPSGRVRFLSIALLLIISGCFGFLGGWLGSKSNDQAVTTEKQQVVLKTQGQLISNIAQKVGQSVVSVDVTSSTNYGSGTYLNFGQSTPSTSEQSAGTGIILTSDGLIITNRHVVPSGTTKVSVTLSDGTTFSDVKVIGRTSSTDSLDIAFLKIQDTNGKKLVAASIGDSSTVKVGDSVIAIGNALGQFQNTVTSGIISGHGRSVQASDSSGSSSENLEDLFQTDAAINEGNSGGPLVNLDGQVVGINTAIAGDAQNIGFSIPINDVSGLIKGVEQTGTLQRPYLGVVFVSLTDDIAKQYNLSVSRGAYIPTSSALGQNPIVSGSPAEKAGLKQGDIITKVNATAIDQNTNLTSVLGKFSVGDKVTLSVVRNGKTITIDVTLSNAPSDSN